VDRFAFVIPVFNHARAAVDVVEQARALGHPVFVIDDGSQDGSGEALAHVPGITLLRHPENRGKGAALCTGFAAAAQVADWAITVDADGQHDPRQAPELIAAIPPGMRPIVVGTRTGMEPSNTPWKSRFGRQFSNFWVRASGGHRVADSQSGFRIYPLPETLALGAKARRFQFEVEVLILARWKGIPATEAPIRVTYSPPGGRISHYRPFVDFWRNTWVFGGLVLRRWFVPRAIRARRREAEYAG
jgi:glycosyltransferase involved in cell wall biosynthesis